MTSIAINGTTSGIGKACAEFLSSSYSVKGFDRPEYVMPDDIDRMLEEVVHYDVFINNVTGLRDPDLYWNFQLEILVRLSEAWGKNPNKTILNISSLSSLLAQAPLGANLNGEFNLMYGANKHALDTTANRIELSDRYLHRVMTLRLGYVDTPALTAPHHAEVVKLHPDKVAETVGWMLNQPRTVHISELTMFAVDLDGRRR